MPPLYQRFTKQSKEGRGGAKIRGIIWDKHKDARWENKTNNINYTSQNIIVGFYLGLPPSIVLFHIGRKVRIITNHIDIHDVLDSA